MGAGNIIGGVLALGVGLAVIDRVVKPQRRRVVYTTRRKKRRAKR